MDRDPQWIVTKVDGRIASVSVDDKGAERILAGLASRAAGSGNDVVSMKLSTEEVFALSDEVRWEDLYLTGTPYRIQVWKALFDITHGPEGPLPPRLLCYSEVAESIGRGSGIRNVAHAIGQNPVNIIIPCHLIIPKDSLMRLHDLEEENSLFKWKTLYMIDRDVNYGEYAQGADLKRRLIQLHMNR